MRTNSLPHRAMCLLFALVLLCLMAGCGSDDDTAHGTSASTTTTRVADTAAMSRIHFPTFELDVPTDWSVRGNVGKLYEGEGLFLLVGPLEEPVEQSDVEEELATELELFFNTEYYRSQVRFQYEKESSSEGVYRRSGTLYNDRTGTTLPFAGVYRTSPGLYCYYFTEDTERTAAIAQYLEASYASLAIL